MIPSRPLFLLRSIANEILEMERVDQHMREMAKEDPDEWRIEIDLKHTKRMKEIIEEIGWPTISKVGETASHASWLLVQHADHDLVFQKECLGLLSQMSSGDIQLREIGYLEDRIRCADGLPQRYGTQFFVDQAGRFGPKPIENTEDLNARRQALAMEPFENYAQRMRDTYEHSIKKPTASS